MNKIYKILKLMYLLSDHELKKSKELVKALEITPRQLTRYKEELITLRIDISSSTGKYGGYLLNSTSIFDKGLKEDEVYMAIKEISETTIELDEAIMRVIELKTYEKEEIKEATYEKQPEDISITNSGTLLTKEEISDEYNILLVIENDLLIETLFSSEYKIVYQGKEISYIRLTSNNIYKTKREILSYGAKIKVLSPIKLVRDITQEIKRMHANIN